MEFETKDSGKRQEFTSGMVRDTQEGKLRFDLAFDGPVASEVFYGDQLVVAFNDWYQHGGIESGADVINLIAQREGGLIKLFERYAGLMTRGAVKYAARNWMKAQGEPELERFKASAARHFFQYIRGDKTKIMRQRCGSTSMVPSLFAGGWCYDR
jgi:hypothetical protein